MGISVYPSAEYCVMMTVCTMKQFLHTIYRENRLNTMNFQYIMSFLNVLLNRNPNFKNERQESLPKTQFLKLLPSVSKLHFNSHKPNFSCISKINFLMYSFNNLINWKTTINKNVFFVNCGKKYLNLWIIMLF